MTSAGGRWRIRQAITLGRRAILHAALVVAGTGGAKAATPAPFVVTVSLNGQPARVLLDTGAERSVLTRAAVTKYGLPLDEWVGSAMRGAGGRIDEHRNAVVRTLSLNGVALFQRIPGQNLSLPVAALDLGEIAGLLGGDMLRHHMLDIDVAMRTLVLGPVDAPMGHDSVSLQRLRQSLLLAPLRLDGHDLVGLVDTGASVSLINARGLHKLGLTPAQVARDQVVSSLGIGGAFTARRHRFGALQLGSLVVPNPDLLTLDRPEPAFDLVLGMDVLGLRRFRLSYGSATLAFR